LASPTISRSPRDLVACTFLNLTAGTTAAMAFDPLAPLANPIEDAGSLSRCGHKELSIPDSQST
jgi:hypothetical protein